MPEEKEEQKVSVSDRIKQFEGKDQAGDGGAGGDDGGSAAPAPEVEAETLETVYEGSGDAKKAITDKVDSGSVKAKKLVTLLYNVTTAQKAALNSDDTFLDNMAKAVKAAGDNANKVLRVLMALSCKPLVMYRHYVKAGGDGVPQFKQIIGWCSLDDLQQIVKSDKGSKLAERFSGEHPDNVLGEGFGAHYAKMKLLYKDKQPWLVDWYDKNTKFDLDKSWEKLSKDKDEWDAGQTGSPSLWLKVYQKSPRGKALNGVATKAMDKIVAFDNVTIAQLDKLFEVRFNATIEDEGGQTHTVKNYQRMYEYLSKLPIDQAVMELVTSWNIENKNKGNGDYSDHSLGMSLGHSNIGGKGNDWVEYDNTIRHEIGHAVDAKLGGFENFSRKTPAKWRKWMDGQRALFAQHFADHAAGGDADVAKHAEDYLDGSIDAGQLGTELDGLADKLTSSKADILKALKVVLDEDDSFGGNAPTIGGRKFRANWGGEYQSYDPAGEDTGAISEYCYNSWAEFFAEIYTCWYAPDGKGGYCEDKSTHTYGGKLPSWVRSNGFGSLVANNDIGKEKGGKPKPKQTGTE